MRTHAIALLLLAITVVGPAIGTAANGAAPAGISGAAPGQTMILDLTPGDAPRGSPPAPMVREKSVASGLYMTGTFNVQWANGVVTVTLGGIENDSFTRTSGTLRLELWASTSNPPRDNVDWVGYRLAVFPTIDPLTTRSFYSNVVQTTTFYPPPSGTYWFILVLTEYDDVHCSVTSGYYCTQDTFNSFAQATFGSSTPRYNYTDLWWNPNESGWGVVIEHHASNIAFIAWYTYDFNGNPKWYVGPNCPMVGDTCISTLYQTTGPPFGPTFNPSAVSAQSVGWVSFSFSGSTSGTMTYNVSGSTGTKAITRQAF